MGQIAPRLPQRLLDVVERLSARRAPLAEINRLVGAEAEALGLTRPSYETVRRLVHEARELHGQPTRGKLLADIATGVRTPLAYPDLATLPPRHRLRDRARK